MTSPKKVGKLGGKNASKHFCKKIKPEYKCGRCHVGRWYLSLPPSPSLEMALGG